MTRFVHDRVKEHLNNDSSSVKKHISKCQNKVHKDIEIKTIAIEKDPANCKLVPSPVYLSGFTLVSCLDLRSRKEAL